jgi:hypothetical protein
MTDAVISLHPLAPSIRALVGNDADDLALLLTLAQCGEIPVTRTSTGGFLVVRRDLSLVVRIFKKYHMEQL